MAPLCTNMILFATSFSNSVRMQIMNQPLLGKIIMQNRLIHILEKNRISTSFDNGGHCMKQTNCPPNEPIYGKRGIAIKVDADQTFNVKPVSDAVHCIDFGCVIKSKYNSEAKKEPVFYMDSNRCTRHINSPPNKQIYGKRGLAFKLELLKASKGKKNCDQNFRQLRFITTFKPESTSPTPETVLQINHQKVEDCMKIGSNILLTSFIAEWNATEEEKWSNDYYFRNLFFYKKGEPIRNKMTLDESSAILEKPMMLWSITLLCESLKCLNVEFPYKYFQKPDELKSSLDTLNRDHAITDEMFARFYRKACVLLLEVNAPMEKLVKCKPNFLKPVNLSKRAKIDSDIKILKNSGDLELKEKYFKDALKFYDLAIFKCGVWGRCASNDLLAQIYSKRAFAWLGLGDFAKVESNLEGAIFFSNLKFNVYNSQEDISMEAKKVLLKK